MPRFTGSTPGKLKVSVDKRDITFIREDIPVIIGKGVNQGIRDYLYWLKDFVLDETGAWNKAWKHDTTTLQHGHEVLRTRAADGKFDFGWSLVADPYLNPKRGKIVKADYGTILERHMGRAWLFPGFEVTQDRIPEMIIKGIKKVL